MFTFLADALEDMLGLLRHEKCVGDNFFQTFVQKVTVYLVCWDMLRSPAMSLDPVCSVSANLVQGRLNVCQMFSAQRCTFKMPVINQFYIATSDTPLTSSALHICYEMLFCSNRICRDRFVP